jgi:hypothetical protein
MKRAPKPTPLKVRTFGSTYLPVSVQDDTQNSHCLVFVVKPLAFVTPTVFHFPHHFGQVTFAGTIKEAP